MNQIPRSISRALDAAQYPAILCSWGRDSSLLLHYALKMKPDMPIYHFGELLPGPAVRLVVDAGATIHYFPPIRSYVSRETLVEEFSFNGTAVPMLSEIVKSDRCSHRYIGAHGMSQFFFPHDVILWGYRKSDEHPLLPGVKFEREIQIGHTRFVAPLYDLTDEDVAAEVNRLALDFVNDEAVEICDSCLHALAGVQERPILNH